MAHRVFVAFLFFLTISAILVVGISGYDYYRTPIPDRPFRSDYETMKPSGNYSHGLGIIGATMIVIGVSTYSSRKRMRVLRSLGSLSWWLEFHIFLCLLGPILVVFHSTFKAGGIAAVSLWCMLSVWASGMIGRFLYVQIPRNLKGTELSEQEVLKELDSMSSALGSSPLGVQLMRKIDEGFASIPKPKRFLQTIALLFRLQMIRRSAKHTVHEMIRKSHLAHKQAETLFALASARTVLLQKTILLTQVERLFYYWHVIHLPFTVIMFITLAAHVGVSVYLGYHWIF